MLKYSSEGAVLIKVRRSGFENRVKRYRAAILWYHTCPSSQAGKLSAQLVNEGGKRKTIKETLEGRTNWLDIDQVLLPD